MSAAVRDEAIRGLLPLLIDRPATADALVEVMDAIETVADLPRPRGKRDAAEWLLTCARLDLEISNAYARDGGDGPPYALPIGAWGASWIARTLGGLAGALSLWIRTIDETQPSLSTGLRADPQAHQIVEASWKHPLTTFGELDALHVSASSLLQLSESKGNAADQWVLDQVV